ncbi:type IV pilus modification PilV family protein [Nitrincola nitratireducens]|uniref:Tfp pilus assembly protein PilV n=1 Tax=Nitrincola nitratireducens TaxID=1229521 RepID=W9UX30_9GAMM|nr:type II secretion system protein [Nitrincola nitratireducens]EXJ11793.1 Tfp pilus assembly protein PilV [Nitrincola nitratireducens]
MNHKQMGSPLAPNYSPSRDLGFSLLEMLVALVILSISLAALYQSAGLSSRIVVAEERRVKGLLIAESVLEGVQMESDRQPRSGVVDDFAWSLRLYALPDHPLQQTIPMALVEVDVSWPSLFRHGSVQLHSFVVLGQE